MTTAMIAMYAADPTNRATVMPSPPDVPATITWIVEAYLGLATLAWLAGLWDRASQTQPTGLAEHNSIDVRLSLAAMTASVAYMLAAMIR